MTTINTKIIASTSDTDTPYTDATKANTQAASLSKGERSIRSQVKIDWRCSLAVGNPAFRKNGTYDYIADARSLRRRIERTLAKVDRKAGKA